jgi:protoporphyrinogen oxidase
MPTHTTETLIIGAGPAGMACAMELSKQKKDFILVERAPRVGGLSKTYSFTEPDGSVFYTDNGPHRFFSKNPYLYEFIGDLLKEDWVQVERYTRQYIDGKYYDYPINALQALKNVGMLKAARMLTDYAWAKVRYGILRKPVKNFEDYVVANFGRTLGEFNMINYTEKIWGVDAATIHPDWASQRIKGLDLRAIITDMAKRLTGKKGGTPKSLVDTFYYPRRGTGQIYETIKEVLAHQGYKILLQTSPQSVRKNGKKFVTRLKNAAGEEVVVESDHIVESVPIVEFLKLLDGVPKAVHQHGKKLKYRSQVYLFVTLNKPQLTRDQWIYFPSKDIPVGRVSEMKNFSAHMSPPDKTSLFMEFFCFENDEVWNKDEHALLELALPHCEAAGLFTRADVRQYYRIAQKNVYPIYDLEYKTYLQGVKEYLNTVKNLHYIGRPGRFRYNNQDHSLEMGILAAKSIIEGKHYDMESIGEEKEYFEKGKVYQKAE